MGTAVWMRSVRSLLPLRLRARFARPSEIRMGSPQYGPLVLDGEVVVDSSAIDARSLLWAPDGRLLAAQELVSWSDGPVTRAVVFDAGRRARIAASAPEKGLANPVSLEAEGTIYRHWNAPS